MRVYAEKKACITCKHYQNPDFNCVSYGQACKVTPAGSTGPVTIEDTEKLHFVLTYKAYGSLIVDGRKKLNALLTSIGFDVTKEIIKFDHEEDEQVEFLQEREWQDEHDEN